MTNEASPFRLTGACSCGACSFETVQPPKSRLMCHCTICQAFTGKAYSDVAIVPSWRVTLHGTEHMLSRKYRRFRFPPPNLDRGRCKTCGQPVVESVGVGSLKILFLPAANFARQDLLPRVENHIFYERRQRDFDDGIPKFKGYFPSQAAIARMIMHAL